MAVELKNLPLEGLKLVSSKIFSDNRGYFFESFNKLDYPGFPEFVQDNLSLSQKGVLRGLHFQKNPQAQDKLIRCLYGKIWDVAVDMRAKSPTFGKFYSIELSEGDGLAFFIPIGFAHGFLTLSENALVSYKTSKYYSPECDSGVKWNDADLKIPWPEKNPVISDKDMDLPEFKQAFYF